jgi:tetratricopeptide (TPR) repeat protein
LGFAVPTTAHHLKKAASSTLPLTTSSAKARELYEKGISDFENLYLERCNDDWRAAVKEDPKFALAWAMIAWNGGNPQEVSDARAKARALAATLTPGEQLMIAWIAKPQEGDYIGGISAMNDLMELYPRDKHVLYLAGNWLMLENGDDQALVIMQKALALDKNFAPGVNDLAYLYARRREFDKALQLMDRYVAMLPKEPNPQDSYAELSRMAGKFDVALERYHAALKIDPDFVSSQLGLADTYALMGNQEQARVEYDKAIRFAHTEADRLTYDMQKATTWVREGKYAEADKALQQIASTAHAKEQDLQEAQALRQMAEYQADDRTALKYAASAEDALGHRDTISAVDRNEELSRILRIRVVRSGDAKLSSEAMARLQSLATSTRNHTILANWHGAAGAVLVEQKKFDEAIAELEEDQDNPFTMDLLAQAYYQANQPEKLHELEVRLRGTNLPTLEQALVVPAARARRPQI